MPSVWNTAISACKTWPSKLASARSSRKKKANLRDLQEEESVSEQDDTVVIAQSTHELVQIEVPLSQQQSTLFRLPVEIRLKIYEFLFGPSLLHIEALEDRLFHVKCLQWESSDGWEGHAHCQQGLFPGVVRVDNSQEPNDQLLALCLTCRQIYNEALPFMLSVPFFAVRHAPRIFVTDSLKLGTLLHIRNLRLDVFFFNFPQFQVPSDAPWNMPGWIQTCHTLGSMRNLRYLRVSISQELFSWYFRIQTHEQNVKIVSELLEPLRSIKIPFGGCFDVVTRGWKLPFEVSDDMPFRLIQERPPSLTDLASRTMELGHVSQDSYIKLTGIPEPPAYRPETRSNIDLVSPTPI